MVFLHGHTVNTRQIFNSLMMLQIPPNTLCISFNSRHAFHSQPFLPFSRCSVCSKRKRRNTLTTQTDFEGSNSFHLSFIRHGNAPRGLQQTPATTTTVPSGRGTCVLIQQRWRVLHSIFQCLFGLTPFFQRVSTYSVSILAAWKTVSMSKWCQTF